MQTDQDEQQTQGDAQKEADEKTPRESEEMEVRRLQRICLLWDSVQIKVSFRSLSLIIQSYRNGCVVVIVQFFNIFVIFRFFYTIVTFF